MIVGTGLALVENAPAPVTVRVPSLAGRHRAGGEWRLMSTILNLRCNRPFDHPLDRRQPSQGGPGRIALRELFFSSRGAGDPATRFTEIGHQLMCICSCGQILLECNHVGCPDSDGMRNELMAAVSRGDSDSLVEQSFVQKYGPTVLAAPTTSGFDRTAWIVPFVALVAGIRLRGRSWSARGKIAPHPPLPTASHPVRGAELEQFRDQARKETDL